MAGCGCQGQDAAWRPPSERAAQQHAQPRVGGPTVRRPVFLTEQQPAAQQK